METQFTAIDFETANSDRGSVCAVGLVCVEAGQIVSEVYELVRPTPSPFDPFNTAIHGIAESDVAHAPTFCELWPRLWSRISGPLVAHNASFDISVLRRALEYSGNQYPRVDYFCTRVISRMAWPEHPTYGLDHIAGVLAIPLKHHHAREDARACALIALEACKRFNVQSLYELEHLCGLRVGRLFEGGYVPCGGPSTGLKRIQEYRKLRAADVVPNGKGVDAGHPFFGRSFVFTGTMLSMSRRDAMQLVTNQGGCCYEVVRRDTDYLVLGQNGYRGYTTGHKSLKMRKAEKLRGKGSSVEILSEADFVSMI